MIVEHSVSRLEVIKLKKFDKVLKFDKLVKVGKSKKI